MNGTADLVIVGGGIMGTCTAFFLRELGFTGSILVLEGDMTFRKASTTLSVASIRQQFATPINARLSQAAFDFFKRLPHRYGVEGEIGLVERGYLILGDRAQREVMQRNRASVLAQGAEVAWLDPDVLATRYPFLNMSGLAGASLGLSGEGWFDAYLLLSVLRRAAQAQGVTYRQAWVTGVETAAGRVQAVQTARGDRIVCGALVNAAGARSGAVAALSGVALPVEPRKRTVFVIRAPVERAEFPMLFDTSGLWLRPEGDGFICGIAPDAWRDRHAGEDFEPDHAMFEEVVWPRLAHRVPAMERLRLMGSWAGHYEMNLFDHNGVVGPHPQIPNMLFATGFSGHGVMHAVPVGRSLAEHLVHGRYTSLDVTPLCYDRIPANRPIVETSIY
jgi:glycine/D-amino acid oxidase-like deaminating enzyme